MSEPETPLGGAADSEPALMDMELDMDVTMQFEASSELEAGMEAEAEREAEAAEIAALEAEAADEADVWAQVEDAEIEAAGEADGDGPEIQAEDDAAIQGEAEAGDESRDAEPRIALHADASAEAEQVRMLEALLFAAAEPLDEQTLAARLPSGADVRQLIVALQEQLRGRGVELASIAGGWRLQTPADLAWLLEDVREERRKLSPAARETLAIIAYHQPVTRAEIEEIRGVAVSKGTVDLLMEVGWVRMRGRRRAPGRPVTYGTTDLFLSHFGLDQLEDLPGKAELKAAGLLDSRLPPDFAVPTPGLIDTENEDPLDDAALENTEFHVDFIGESEEADEKQAVTA